MYASTQFLSHTALWEDLDNHDRQPEGPVLSVTSAIYTVAEICEFAARLFQSGLYADRAILNLSLRNNQGRKFWVSEFTRMRFAMIE
ncbi:hypothetical protein [Tianweitania sediminis]|uniref:Uncharacterized protein n=1 Tax=Tianweitania sediminis TaxID=1502156 RepID=A0A8J7R1I7_9HYPH|nr:hypothetical protein [Tianweitania sediminis]MBP0438505.1 hypothetical protein [Tianweitania sediminis]